MLYFLISEHVHYVVVIAYWSVLVVQLIMSTRALRKLHGGQALPDLSHLVAGNENDEPVEEGEVSPVTLLSNSKKTRRKQLAEAVNPFDLVCILGFG